MILALARRGQAARAEADASAASTGRRARRAGEPDVLTPQDMRRQSVREALTMLAHMQAHARRAVACRPPVLRRAARFAARESQRLMERSVLELVTTERQIAEWSDPAGRAARATPSSSSSAARPCLESYPEIIDRCLKATDRALAKAGRRLGRDRRGRSPRRRPLRGRGRGRPHAGRRPTSSTAARRAIDKVDATGYDEQELLHYAAQEADRGPQTPESRTPDAPDAR